MKLTVTIGEDTVTVEVKHSDLVRLEEHDPDYAQQVADGEQLSFTLRRRYILAWIAASRAARRGLIDVEVPRTLSGFLDVVDVVSAGEVI